jgi:hypothetical protein
MIEPPTDFAYLLEPEPKTMTVAELRKQVKNVTTIIASRGNISPFADPATKRRTRGSRKFYEVCQRGGVGWYLPAWVVSQLSRFPKDAVCSVVPVTLEGSALRERIKIKKDPEHKLHALQIQWHKGEYFFVLIREDSWV